MGCGDLFQNFWFWSFSSTHEFVGKCTAKELPFMGAWHGHTVHTLALVLVLGSLEGAGKRAWFSGALFCLMITTKPVLFTARAHAHTY
jgi:hypothetical protein